MSNCQDRSPVHSDSTAATPQALLVRQRALQARIRALYTTIQRDAAHTQRLEGEITAAAAHSVNLTDQIQVLKTRITQLEQRLHTAQQQHFQFTTALHAVLHRWHRIQHSATWSLAQPVYQLERVGAVMLRGIMYVLYLVYWSVTLQLRQQLQWRRRARFLLTTTLFDAHWYSSQYPAVLTWNAPLILHWLRYGWREQKQPHLLFDVTWYCAQQPQLYTQLIQARRHQPADPLTHYWLSGERAGYTPHPLFDAAWYRTHYADIAATPTINALQHYLHAGGREWRDPHPLFQSAWYLSQLPGEQRHTVHNPLLHYLQHGALNGYSPHPLFDTQWYAVQYGAHVTTGMDLLQHYICYGAAERYDPNPLFNSQWYCNHYGLAPTVNPLYHYVTIGAAAGYHPHPLFDAPWYLARYPDVADNQHNPLAHYLHYGANEGRDPHPQFHVAHYLQRYPHIRSQHLNPLVHFLTHHGNADPNVITFELGIAAPVPNQYAALAQQLGNQHPLITIDHFHPSARFTTAPIFQPPVTVIVPNFNHAAYLRQRLDSIYNQTYPALTVLLLDDASTDASRPILMEYAARYPTRTRTLFNEQPSGSVFQQWQRGIEAATTELLWIAESDDWCDANFVAQLIPFFMDEAVRLAYAQSQFMDERGQPTAFRCHDYLAELSTTHWQQPYVNTAHHEVAAFLGRKNTIPNVSAVVFRKPDLTLLLTSTPWRDLRICGDWLFYLYLLRGGKIAYTPTTTNYYRLHGRNSSALTYRTPAYYQEHALVAATIARLYAVPPATLQAHYQYVARFYRDHANELDGQGISLSLLYDQQCIAAAAEKRLPNILMGIFGFATGGGEVFPIRLANALHQAGYALTVFNYAGEPFNPAVRALLHRDIAVTERTAWLPDVAELLDAFGIDIAHTHHASVDQTVALAKLNTLSLIRHVVTMHGMYEGMEPWLFQIMWERIGSAVDHWVAVAQKNITPFILSGCYHPARFTHIHNGMAFTPYTPIARAALGLNTDAFVICLASRAIAEKGWRTAIAITTRARQLSTLDIQLLLLGDGVVYDELRTETLPPYIHLLGFVAQPVAYFALADVGLLPSTFPGESFPLTAIECLVAGRPFIASDVGEIRAMLTNDAGEIAGELIDVSSGAVPIETTAQQIVTLATDAALYAHKAAVARQLAPRFDLTIVMERYAALYQTLCTTEYVDAMAANEWPM